MAEKSKKSTESSSPKRATKKASKGNLKVAEHYFYARQFSAQNVGSEKLYVLRGEAAHDPLLNKTVVVAPIDDDLNLGLVVVTQATVNAKKLSEGQKYYAIEALKRLLAWEAPETARVIRSLVTRQALKLDEQNSPVNGATATPA